LIISVIKIDKLVSERVRGKKQKRKLSRKKALESTYITQYTKNTLRKRTRFRGLSLVNSVNVQPYYLVSNVMMVSLKMMKERRRRIRNCCNKNYNKEKPMQTVNDVDDEKTSEYVKHTYSSNLIIRLKHIHTIHIIKKTLTLVHPQQKY